MSHLLKTVASVTLAGSIFMSTSAFADTTTTSDVPLPPTITVVAPQAEVVPTSMTTEKNITRVRTKGAALITDRTKALAKLRLRVTGSKQLSDDQKKTLTDMIDTNVSGLTTLGATLAAETDITKAKDESKSILSTYRIFAVFIPKVSHLMGLYIDQTHVANLTGTTFPKLQTKLDTWKAKGVDTTTFQQSLDTAKVTITTISSQLTDLVTKTNALQPSDYPTTSKTTLSDIRVGIKSVGTELSTLRKTLSWKTPKTPKTSTK